VSKRRLVTTAAWALACTAGQAADALEPPP
jgi:hypothetical protein